MRNINKYDCDNIFNLLEKLTVKSKYLDVNVSLEGDVLKISLASDGSFTKA